MLKRRIHVDGAHVTAPGATFKENWAYLRDTRMVDVVCDLRDYCIEMGTFSFWVDVDELRHEYAITQTESTELGTYDDVTLAMANKTFRDRGLPVQRDHARETRVFCDLKSVYLRDDREVRL